ncbi:MAG: ACT domain-containing protein [Nitrososphaerota archaeon]
MIENGIRVDDSGRFFVGEIEISDTAISRAASVDRRAVRETATYVLSHPELKSILCKIRPFGSSLADVASALGFSVITIEADPKAPGILADVAGVLAKRGIVIRQALADDPELVPEPKLTIVAEGNLPPDTLEEMRSLKSVKTIMLKK